MRRIIMKLSIALALLVGGGGVGRAQDLMKGYEAYESGDFSTALREWTALAERGSAVAQNNVGAMYMKGQGVSQSDYEAVKWYRLSASQGYAQAQHNLGGAYRDGKGVLQDYREALKWFRMAASQGNADGQAGLGSMYGLGHGVIQDNVYAHMWSNIAAANGSDVGAKNRDFAARKMTNGQIAQAQELARQCVAKNYKGC
ncbi:tetratricopeptide repeat protein [Sphingorhabdus sp.]|uniref:tetratricopeptide repeat protein n=1 Tax=Sphingorhabdus sp. TaxID=1902408 RepID=UPI0038FBF442